jgi:hypothetical protein
MKFNVYTNNATPHHDSDVCVCTCICIAISFLIPGNLRKKLSNVGIASMSRFDAGKDSGLSGLVDPDSHGLDPSCHSLNKLSARHHNLTQTFIDLGSVGWYEK